jgi:hypothetical protein
MRPALIPEMECSMRSYGHYKTPRIPLGTLPSREHCSEVISAGESLRGAITVRSLHTAAYQTEVFIGRQATARLKAVSFLSPLYPF